MEDIKKGLLSENKTFVFDGNNASNLNFVADKFGFQASQMNYSIINGNENVVNELNKFPEKIGVISLNTMSRPYSKQAELLRDKVKVLAVRSGSTVYTVNAKNLSEMQYPLTRLVYFLNNEGGFGMAKGIIRFACTQKGQLVVEKEGLQPYNLFKREVEMK